MGSAILATSLAALMLTPGVASAQERIKRFVFVSQRDEISDHDTSVLFTTALEVSLLTKPQLIWRCNGRRVQLYVFADEFLDNEPIAIRYRFDSDPASLIERWNPSTDGTSAYAPSATTPHFTAAATAATSVLIRAKDFRGTAHDMRFSMMGLTAGLAKLPCAPGPPSTAENSGGVTIDRARRSVALLPASTLGRQADGAYLQLQCSSTSREVALMVPAVLKSGPSNPIATRTWVDSLHVQPEPWVEASTGGRFNVSYDRRDVTDLLLQADALSVAVFASGGMVAEMVFELAGLDDAVSFLPCWLN